MWRHTGRSSALEKAQALLSEKKHNKDANIAQEPRVGDNGHTDPGQSFKRQTGFPSKRILLQDLSDMSSVSLLSEPGDGTMSSTAAGKNFGKEKEDLIPQTFPGGVGGGSSRFLKKATPPSAINNSQSPVVSRSKIHQPSGPSPVDRYVSSSQRCSQNTTLSRLAQIEERIRSRKQSHPDAKVQGTEVAKSAEMAASDLGLPPRRSASPSQASSDLSLRGKRFLKKTAAVAFDSSIPAASVPRKISAGVKASTVATPLAISRAHPNRAVGGVSLDSDEEDMKKLLGDSLDSIEDHPVRPGRSFSMKVAGKRASPPQHSSPLGSPSLSRYQPSMSFSPSPLARVGSPPRASSSISGHSEVRSLEELFPFGSQHSLSERSVSSEDFKINVMTLDDLAPATLGLPKESEPKPSGKQQDTEDEVTHYQSDFESESGTQPDNTASEISEVLGGEEGISDIREEASDSERCREGRQEDSDTSRSYATRTSSSRSPRRCSPRSSLCSSDTVTLSPPATSSAMREVGVQTVPDALAYTWSAGVATMGPSLGMAYVDPSPVASHTISAEAVEALSAYSPAMFALNDMLRQQLAMTRQFIQASRHLHSSLVQSLGPPDYSYTTLEDTKEFIRKNKPPKLTVEKALEEVLQEMRDYHYI